MEDALKDRLRTLVETEVLCVSASAADYWQCCSFSALMLLKVEFLLKIMVNIPRTRGLVDSPWQPLGILFAITTLGQLVSALARSRGHRKRSQLPVSRTRTYRHVWTGPSV